MKKLVFIHHSVGGHWLAHEHGGLVSEVNRLGFYVNDITYGWQPPQLSDNAFKRARNRVFQRLEYRPGRAYGIGDRTDIGHFCEWFLGPDSRLIMEAVYRVNGETTAFGDHANARSAHPMENPGIDVENDVLMIKPCYPNSLYRGNGEDGASAEASPPRGFSAGSEHHTVANCKRVFNDILAYFQGRPDKFFVVVTAPPRLELPDGGATARAFNNWLVHDWLRANGYAGKNVMVFDLYNILTSGSGGGGSDVGKEEGNHHRVWHGVEQHVVQDANNLLSCPAQEGDHHPSPAGLRKASSEFGALLLARYSEWQ